MSDHVHTQACVVTCRRYDGTTESKDPAPATKPLGHEERARAWLVDGPYTTDLESCVKRLATAFSEVEAETMAEAVRGQHPRRCRQTCGTHTHLVTSQLSEPKAEPEFTGTPMTRDQESVMRKEIWSKPAEIGLEMGPSMKALLDAAEPKAKEALVSVAEFYRADAAGKVSHVRTELEPTCTCGASATGSKIHSDWCP